MDKSHYFFLFEFVSSWKLILFFYAIFIITDLQFISKMSISRAYLYCIQKSSSSYTQMTRFMTMLLLPNIIFWNHTKNICQWEQQHLRKLSFLVASKLSIIAKRQKTKRLNIYITIQDMSEYCLKIVMLYFLIVMTI